MGLRLRQSLAHNGAVYDKLAGLAIAAIALTRFWAYSSILTPPRDTPAIMLLTDGGKYLPLMSLLWLVAGLWALFDVLIRDTGWSEALFLALMLVWGGGYFLAWMSMGGHAQDWMNATLYIGVALYTLFRYLENARQARIIRLHDRQGLLVVTGPIPILPGGGGPKMHAHYER